MQVCIPDEQQKQLVNENFKKRALGTHSRRPLRCLVSIVGIGKPIVRKQFLGYLWT